MVNDSSILLVGHATLDRYGERLIPGGAAYYCSEAYHRFGDLVMVATSVGSSYSTAKIFEGITTAVRPGPATTVFTNLYPEPGKRVQYLESLARAIRPEDVPTGWLNSPIVHLAPVFGEVDLSAWKMAVSARLLAISAQGWLRGLSAGKEDSLAKDSDRAPLLSGCARRVIHRPWDVTTSELRGVDVACLSTEDLRGQGDLLDRLRASVPTVALTCGEQGCDIFVRGTHVHVGVFATTAVDPTGAGDVFAAGFIHRLARGDDVIMAAKFGAAAASIVIEGQGGSRLGRVCEAAERAHAIGNSR